MSRLKQKKKLGVLAFALVTIWYHDLLLPRNRLQKPLFLEFHQTTKQDAKDRFAELFPADRFPICDVKARTQITIF